MVAGQNSVSSLYQLELETNSAVKSWIQLELAVYSWSQPYSAGYECIHLKIVISTFYILGQCEKNALKKCLTDTKKSLFLQDSNC